MPVMALRQGAYHQENQKDWLRVSDYVQSRLDFLGWYTNSLPCTSPLRVSPSVPVTFVVGQLVLL